MYLKQPLKTQIISVFILLMMLITSCGGSKIVAENNQLKNRVLELEYRVYELTESSNHLFEGVLQDVNLLMIIPNEESLSLALDLIDGFESSYPKNENLYKLENKKEEIKQILSQNSSSQPTSSFRNNSTKINNSTNSNPPKLQFSVQVSKKKQGFVNIELRIQNMSNQRITNLWIKATVIDQNGDSYGITQDFFFNQLGSYDYKTEILSWEYVRMDEIAGIQLSQIRFSQNRYSRLAKEEECVIGQGNVKIFLDF